MYQVDLNCDLGESFGAYNMGMDEEILPCITSANVACGFHAADPLVMAKTVSLAKQFNISLGAHPGFPDLLGFGRRSMAISPAEAKAYTLYQIGALSAFSRSVGLPLNHVKLHGAFYNQAAKDPSLAEAVCSAVREFDRELVVLTLSGSLMLDTAKAMGLSAASEVFADRAYDSSGALVPRTQPGALITDEDESVARVVKMVKTGKVTSIDGKEVSVSAHSVCVHGDGEKALAFVKKIRAALEADHIQLCPLKELSL